MQIKPRRKILPSVSDRYQRFIANRPYIANGGLLMLPPQRIDPTKPKEIIPSPTRPSRREIPACAKQYRGEFFRCHRTPQTSLTSAAARGPISRLMLHTIV